MEEYRLYENLSARQKLLAELEAGYCSGEQEGWYTLDVVEKELGLQKE